MQRGAFLTGGAALAAAVPLPASHLARLEARYGGRLGVLGVNSANGSRIAYRADERFAMCSTFKLLLVAAILSRVDAGRERLERHVPYGKADLLEYAPVTKANVSAGFMTVQALCQAAIEYSDNTAANLLLRAIGGPPHLTGYARSLGDSRTRLDRDEPAMSAALPGDERDTTTPAAMAADVQTLLTGRVLSTPSRRKLTVWLAQCTTGERCIRAGLPATWKAGDKTGSGGHTTRNDVAVVYPPGRAPIIIAAYYTGSSASASAREDVLADVGRIVSAAFG